MNFIEDRMVWRGVMRAFMLDESRLIDLEGAFRSSKTTACLRKVAKACVRHPGIHWWINRYSDGDTQRQLKPQWRAMCQRMGLATEWDSVEQADVLPNGSRVYVFGVKAQDQAARYSKIRGLTLAGIYNDQSEELPHDIFLEFAGRLSQAGYPHQILLSPNPPDENHWLAKTEFRSGGLLESFGDLGAIFTVKGPTGEAWTDRRYYAVPIHANAHNLPPDMLGSLVRTYPPEHPKHRSAVLGLRGLNVTGEPVYKGLFKRPVHSVPLLFNPHRPLLEAIDFGKHHPCIVWAQQPFEGGLHLLGGILGQDFFLDDFLPIVLQYRNEWFPDVQSVETCCDPAGSHENSQGIRFNGVDLLKRFGFTPRWVDSANAPDVRLASIEAIAAHMRRRTTTGEAFGVDSRRERWLRIGQDGPVEEGFLADAFEAGYVWDEHFVSVGSKPVRKPKKDGWFEHGMNCAEYLELNFGAARATQEQRQRQRQQRTVQQARLPRYVRGELGW